MKVRFAIIFLTRPLLWKTNISPHPHLQNTKTINLTQPLKPNLCNFAEFQVLANRRLGNVLFLAADLIQ